MTRIELVKRLVPQNIANCMNEADQKEHGVTTTAQDQAKYTREWERAHQGKYAQWCGRNGLVPGWNATHKKSTYTEGWPDFSVPYRNQTLYLEFKVPGGRLSPAQVKLHADFLRNGTSIRIVESDLEAIRVTKLWLKANFPDWRPL